MLIVALVAVGLLAVLPRACCWPGARAKSASVREIGERLEAVAQTGDLAERLGPHAAEGSAGELAAERRPARSRGCSRTRRSRGRARASSTAASPKRCTRPWPSSATASSSPTPGSPSCAASRRPCNSSAGRCRTSCIPISPSCWPSTCAATGRRAGARAPRSRAARGGRPRRRGSSSRSRTITYEGQPALLVSAVEMSAAPRWPGARATATAWEALDALGEGVITTDVAGPHRLRQPGRRDADRQAGGGCARQARCSRSST